eukprot:1599762-Amphidinium_carterae.1
MQSCALKEERSATVFLTRLAPRCPCSGQLPQCFKNPNMLNHVQTRSLSVLHRRLMMQLRSGINQRLCSIEIIKDLGEGRNSAMQR